ncbi:MAG: FAD:protein FMN transferase [Halieaceae bacterium]
MTSAGKRKSHSLQWLFCCACLLLLSACGSTDKPLQLSGYGLGTSWHVTLLPGQNEVDEATVQALVEGQLGRVNRSMSTYLPASEINRFNASTLGVWQQPSADFLKVLDAAIDIGGKTAGGYDITIGPLVDLWGFGPGEPRIGMPSRQAVSEAKAQVGLDSLERRDEEARRLKPIELDFSSIAKGYAVDLIAEALLANDVNDFLVEVGGEMRVAGASPRGDAWRVAIEQPIVERREVATAINLVDQSVATSGDYRNYFDLNGTRYSHTIDPRTGYPVRHDLVSVTVVHDSAMLADAWATALTVLGAEGAAQLAEELQLAVYFIRSEGEDFIASHSTAFEPYLAEKRVSAD